MDEGPKRTDFGSSEALLRDIQERAEDIEKAVLCPPGFTIAFKGQQVSRPSHTFTMLLHYTNGERAIINGNDAEIVLNDGIFNRMKIKIEFAK